MPSAPTLLAFAAAATALVLLPGPNLIYIVSRGIAQGRRAALASTLGVTTATAVFVVLTAFGLTALIASSTSPSRRSSTPVSPTWATSRSASSGPRAASGSRLHRR